MEERPANAKRLATTAAMNQRKKLIHLQMPTFTQRCHQRGPEALIEGFRDYGLTPDERGQIPHLSREAAALIRSCGYTARAGQTWRCPLLPDELVHGYTFLRHLTNADWFVRRLGYGPFDWHPKRAAFQAIAPPDPISAHENSILKLLHKQPDKRLTRRQIQQRVSRRFFTRYLDRMLCHLLALDRITIESGWIYPHSRTVFDALQRQAREPRRPVPVYAK